MLKKKAKEELEKPENKNLDNFELNNLDYDEACAKKVKPTMHTRFLM